MTLRRLACLLAPLALLAAPRLADADSRPVAATETTPRPARPLSAPAVPRDKTRVTVLLYHMFGNIESPFAIEPKELEEQLAFLSEHRISVISNADLLRFLDGEIELPERAAVITVDDGHKSVYTRAYPLFQKHHMPFVLALNTGAIEGGRKEAVSWDMVREMAGSGLCEIESHSHIHGHMDRLTIETNRREAELSRSILEARTGVRPEAFVFPFGGNDAKVRKVVEESGYRAAFAAWGGHVTARSPRYALPRVGVLRGMGISAFAKLFEG
jgi:peptidoglycan/xylan/chitin deacetylase (PgdA/CDA1 family)